jgi:hypothetical protein
MTTNSHQLKQLQTKKRSLETRQMELHTARAKVSAESEAIKAELTEINQKIGQFHSPAGEPVVSEHALLRYLERVKGVDLNVIRKEILDGRVDQIRHLKTCDIRMANGLKMVVKNCVVVTLIEL